MTNQTKTYNLYVPAVFPKGHRREGQPTNFMTKIHNAVRETPGWRKTFILKHGFRGWQYKVDNVLKGYAKIKITDEKNSIVMGMVFYQKAHVTYNTCHDILDITVDGRKADEEFFLSGIGLSRADFISMYIRKRNNKSVIHYDGIMITLSSDAVF